ncbi:MAG: hypothetical protein ABIO24_01080, partial [Saprospiraceae bacterium]
PPVFNVLPQNLNVECWPNGDSENYLFDWLDHFGYAEVSDQCGAVTTEFLLLSEKPGCGNTWSRTYQFRATDECGNTNFVTATFAIVDTTPPVILICPPGAFLTCINDLPLPDLTGVIASDNCTEHVKIMVTTYTSGAGCKYWPMTVSYWYMAMDDCGNMISNCDQSFQVIDTLAPIYAGPDTILVVCLDDLPAPGQIMGILTPYMEDNCSDFICVGHIVGEIAGVSVTYTMVAKDFCGNVAGEFTVTFLATGSCKPICTASQDTWGDPAGKIDGMSTTTAIDQLILADGNITAGKLGKSLSAASSACLQKILPAHGGTAQLGPGNYGASLCLPPSKFLDSEGMLKNELAGNVMAMQLNIRYNRAFNSRDLGKVQLTKLPACLVPVEVLNKMESNHYTVQDLVNLSDDYLAGVGFYPAGFGALLSEALDNLNNYWKNCAANPTDPCPDNAPNTLLAGTDKAVTELSPKAGLTTDREQVVSNGGGFELYQNVPNPFSDRTVIGFRL